MNSKFLLTILLAILSLLTSVMIQAKVKNSGDAGAVEFTCVAWEYLPYPEPVYPHVRKHQQLLLSDGERSRIYPIKGAESLELLTHKDKAADTGISNIPLECELIGSAPVPKGVK